MQQKLELKNNIFYFIFRRKTTESKSPSASRFSEATLTSLLRKLTFCDSSENQIYLLLNAIEAKDPYTKGHSESVAKYSVMIAKELGLTDSEIDEIEIAAHLHDIGKIMIDRRLLLKPSNLNDAEEKIIKRHPEIGARILKVLCLQEKIINSVLYHHERWDGKGYPESLFAYEIPLYSRILSVSDVYDALTSNRPYRQAISPLQALAEIERNSGTQFDPEVVKAFKSALNRRKF